MKKKDLYQFHLQIQQWKGNVLYQFFSGKIQAFYKNNGIKLDSLTHTLDNLQREYFVIDKDNNIAQVKKQDSEEMVPVCHEGKTYEEYKEKYEAIMNQDCHIIF